MTLSFPPERSQRTAITELIGERAKIWLEDKLPCLDQSASSGVANAA